MTSLTPEEIQDFLDALDAAGDRLREVLEADDAAESPAVQYYLDGSTFLEAGCLMVEQLAERFPDVFRALHDGHYRPLFDQARKGQIGWTEALEGLPVFLREYAADKVHQEILDDE